MIDLLEYSAKKRWERNRAEGRAIKSRSMSEKEIFLSIPEFNSFEQIISNVNFGGGEPSPHLKYERRELESHKFMRSENFVLCEDFTFLLPWKRIERSIDQWSRLSDGWDDEDSVAPLPSALAAMKSFVRRAKAAHVPAPRAYIAGDAEIGMSWERGGQIATASFLPDGRFLAYCPRETGEAVRIVGGYDLADNPADFFAAINALT